MKNLKCPICGKDDITNEPAKESCFGTWYFCPECGILLVEDNLFSGENSEFIKHCIYYFIHNVAKPKEKRYGKRKYAFGVNGKSNNACEYLTEEEILSYGPKSMSEKLDCVLLNIESKSKYEGEWISLYDLPEREVARIFFVDDPEMEGRTEKARMKFDDQIRMMLKGLSKYIDFDRKEDSSATNATIISINTEGWIKLSDLHKSNAESKTIFVAMSFDSKMEPIRETIKKVIESDCGYKAIFIDQKKYNGQIVPEMLYSIRKSKCVIADLTLGNNGAYYEAGYAEALGKQVIITCASDPEIEEIRETEWGKTNHEKNRRKENLLHFDVRQKNAILWENKEDLENRLKDRIEATIEKA